jgi:beta-1,4-mannosyl-glycoprotein beta-1,4-N-acetylglucosaminyltransferase
MIVDAIMFNDEVDLLEFRLELLDPVVDRFLVIEADRTFTGIPKASVLESMRPILSPYASKLTTVRTKLDEDAPSPWRREEQQRRHMLEALKRLDLHDDDLVVVGDVDEVPEPHVIEALAEALRRPTRLIMKYYRYYANWLMPYRWWNSTVVCRPAHFSEPMLLERFGLPNSFDDPTYRDLQLRDAGWHLSFMGGIDAIRKKLNSYSHQEVNLGVFQTGTLLDRCVGLGITLDGRHQLKKERYEELDPPLKKLADAKPHLFRFEAPPAPLALRAYRGYTWATYRHLVPNRLAYHLDGPARWARAVALPLGLGLDCLLSARRRLVPDKSDRWGNPLRYDLSQLKEVHGDAAFDLTSIRRGSS